MDILNSIHFLADKYKNSSYNQERFERLLMRMDLGQYTEHFINASRQSLYPKNYKIKFVLDEDQEKLGKIFNDFIIGQGKNVIISPLFENYLNQIFEYGKMTMIDKSELLIVLCYIFIKFSTEKCFGTLNESPLTLRMHFAYAMLNMILQINPKRFNINMINNWKTRLRDGSCSDELSNDVKSAICGLTLFQEVCPQNWR